MPRNGSTELNHPFLKTLSIPHGIESSRTVGHSRDKLSNHLMPEKCKHSRCWASQWQFRATSRVRVGKAVAPRQTRYEIHPSVYIMHVCNLRTSVYVLRIPGHLRGRRGGYASGVACVNAFLCSRIGLTRVSNTCDGVMV